MPGHLAHVAGLAEAIWESECVQHLSDEEIHLEYIANEVGGVDVLKALNADPLPDEAFDWSGIPEEIYSTVQAIQDPCDACANALLDVEYRTAMRRILARAARNDPSLFRRRGSPVRGAATVAWVIATANRTMAPIGRLWPARNCSHISASPGRVSDRAQSLIRAAGIHERLTYGSLGVGDPALLVFPSSARARRRA